MSVHTSQKIGCDETGDGTAAKPFKTVLRALKSIEGDESITILVDNLEEGADMNNYIEVSASQKKKTDEVISSRFTQR